MFRRVRLLHLIPAALLAACAPTTRLALPRGNSQLDATNDDGGILSEMVVACPRIPVTARVRVEGTIQGKKVRRSVWAGTDSNDMRLEASAEDGSPFVLWGSRRTDVRRSGLWLPRERKVVVDDDLRALASAAIGVPLDGLELNGLLTTCPMFDNGGVEVYAVSPNARQLVFAQNESHTIAIDMNRRDAGSSWHVRSVTVTRVGWPRWRVLFSSPIGAIPAQVRLTRLEWTGQPSSDLDLRLTIDRVRVDMGIGPSVLTPSVPSSEERVSLSDLTSSRNGRPVLAD